MHTLHLQAERHNLYKTFTKRNKNAKIQQIASSSKQKRTQKSHQDYTKKNTENKDKKIKIKTHPDPNLLIFQKGKVPYLKVKKI
jgi:L-rhamnose mutarotase